jgi:hypothetical protein
MISSAGAFPHSAKTLSILDAAFSKPLTIDGQLENALSPGPCEPALALGRKRDVRDEFSLLERRRTGACMAWPPSAIIS